MYRDLESIQVGNKELILAPGKRLSHDPRVEREVLHPKPLMTEAKAKGVLIAIGGAATNDNLQVIVDHLPPQGDLAISTVTTGIPEEQYSSYSERFTHIGLTSQPYHFGEHLIPQEAHAMLRLADGMFTTGGNQARGVDTLRRSGFENKLHDFYHSGKVVAGSSAGAHMLGMITPFENETKEGVGLARLTSYETHQRRRNGAERQRLVVEASDLISVGLDEGGGAIDYADGRLHFFGEEANLTWRYNGVQEDLPVRPGQTVELWSLRRKQPFKQFEK